MKRVLIIEDDTSIRECIAEVLDMEGYWVSQAGDGREGLRVARERPPNLILLDLMMPIMNGWQFRDAQKEDAALADIPVIVISAVAKEPWSRLEGAAALFPKPFDTAGLLAAVARHATTEAVADRVICRGPAGLRGGVHSPSRPVSARTHTALRGLADGGERGEEPGMKREPPSGLIARTRRWS